MSSTRSSSPGATGPVVERFDDEEDVILLVDSPAASRKGIRTLVAMPAHNEEAAIAKTVLGARRHADAVLVVDDGSKDETAAIAEALGAIVVRHETNRGYGARCRRSLPPRGGLASRSWSSSMPTASTTLQRSRTCLRSSGGGMTWSSAPGSSMARPASSPRIERSG